MTETTLEQACWYQAATLAERIIAAAKEFPELEPEQRDAAARRAECWRSVFPSADQNYFDRRLARSGLDYESFLALLGESPEATAHRFRHSPAWLTELLEALSAPTSVTPLPLSAQLRDDEVVGLLEAVRPLMARGCERLRAGIRRLLDEQPDGPWDPTNIEELVFAPLPRRMVQMMSRTLALELHVARLRGRLDGGTAKERFQSFVGMLRNPAYVLELFAEYPVLARQLVNAIEQWAACTLELLERLGADWEEIRSTFDRSKNPGVLVALDAGMGDTHRNGRSVCAATFQSGMRLVYKPRSLALDVHFQDLLRWINQRGAHPPFRTLKILDRGSYGWIEFVEAHGCTSPEEVQRFYERQGGYLALLYALRATDFHFENLIAAGEHPVLLDLEALFHPTPAGAGMNSAEELAAAALGASVVSTGLPPHRMWDTAESDGIDLSGLGGAADQMTPFALPLWEGIGTDELRLVRKRMAAGGSANRPTCNGLEVDPLDYADVTSGAFASMYRLLVEHRDELLASGGPLAAFANDEVRVIVRETQTYGALLRESFHPDVLRDALDRDRMFDRLWGWVPQQPALAALIPLEIEDLHRADIPIFTTAPCSRDLWSSAEVRIRDFFGKSGLYTAVDHIRRMGEPDLARQLWFLRTSLGTLAMDPERATFPTYHVPERVPAVDREQALGAARAVGNRLDELAFRGAGGEASWIGLTPTPQGHLQLTPLGMDLYDGLPGVALFLAYLGDITGEARYTELARGALKTLRTQVRRNRSSLLPVGGFTGWGGVIYTLAHLSALWEDAALAREAQDIAAVLGSLIAADELFDFIGGAAGCIAGLSSLYHLAFSPRILELMIACGDRLLATAVPMPQGIGWVAKFGGPTPLAGLSHGVAGIALALVEAAGLTGQARFRDAALAAIAYERSIFSTEAGNWRDLREFPASAGAPAGDSFHMAWCHGAPGIGLARLRSLAALDGAAARTEIETALQTTVVHGFGHNHCLCHGDLGNLDLLLEASSVLGRPWPAEAARLGGIILESIRRHGPLCGLPLGVESPGLMTGLAGIGYGLLRIADPEGVPSVLLLAPPCAAYAERQA